MPISMAFGRRRSAAVGVLLSACMAFGAHASCTRLNPADDVVDFVRSIPNLDLPDTLNFNGSYLQLLERAYDCAPGQEDFIVDVNFSGLKYERDLVAEGQTFAVYSLSDRSPLIGFAYGMSVAGQGGTREPVTMAGRFRYPGRAIPTQAPVQAGLQVFIWFRGGAMESVPRTLVGTAESWPESDPSQRLRHSITLQFDIAPVTCTLSNTAHALADVSADALATPGTWANESTFDVPMNCRSANVDVTFSVDDASGSNSTDGSLAPSSGSTAEGVRLQLLRGGQPVTLGQAWRHGYSSKGSQVIPFSARYLRNAAPLVAGDINGQAVLSADYR